MPSIEVKKNQIEEVNGRREVNLKVHYQAKDLFFDSRTIIYDIVVTVKGQESYQQVFIRKRDKVVDSIVILVHEEVISLVLVPRLNQRTVF